jgi:hypothetical protein
MLHEKMKRWGGAAADYRRVLELQPGHAEARRRLRALPQSWEPGNP